MHGACRLKIAQNAQLSYVDSPWNGFESVPIAPPAHACKHPFKITRPRTIVIIIFEPVFVIFSRHVYASGHWFTSAVASLPALGPWAAERGPSLESIYRVSLTADLCEGNKIISVTKLFHRNELGALQKEKNPGALGTCPVCPLDKTALHVRCVGMRGRNPCCHRQKKTNTLWRCLAELRGLIPQFLCDIPFPLSLPLPSPG